MSTKERLYYRFLRCANILRAATRHYNKALRLLLLCLIIPGCQVGEETIPVSRTEIESATAAAWYEIKTPLAVMPLWYRSRCQASYQTGMESQNVGCSCIYKKVNTGHAYPVVTPAPLWRIVAICVIFIPFLVGVALSNKEVQNFCFGKEGYNDEMLGCWFGVTCLLMILPFLLCWPTNWLFQLLAYGFTGQWYYLPWHFVTFCFFAIFLALLSIISIVPLLDLMKSGPSVKGMLGASGLVLEIAGHVFTIRDIVSLACWFVR